MAPTPSAGDASRASDAPTPFRAAVRDAVRFWELRRVAYNLLLGALCAGWVIATWPHLRGAFTPLHLFQLGVLAAIWNVFYCAGYAVDLAFQGPDVRAAWVRWRWLLWLFGTLFALFVEYYWIGDEIYPSLR